MFRTANGVLSRSATARAPESLRFSPMAIRALATAIDDLLLPQDGAGLGSQHNAALQGQPAVRSVCCHRSASMLANIAACCRVTLPRPARPMRRRNWPSRRDGTGALSMAAARAGELVQPSPPR